MKHIVRSAFFITLGGALPLMAGVLLLIPYTESLNTSDYGALAIYISYSLLVQILMNYGVDSFVSVHYYDHKDDPHALKKFLAEISGGLLLYGIVLIAILSILGWFGFSLIFKESNITFWPYGFMSILTGFFNAWFRMYANLQIYAERAIKYFLLGLFNLVVTVGISTYLVYTNPYTLIGPMWGRLLSGVLIFLLTFGFGFREFGLRWNSKILIPVKQYSTPIVIFSLLTWVLGYINNYILNAFATQSDVGVYDFALKCTLVIEYAGMGLLGTISPRIYQIWQRTDNKISTIEVNRYYHAYSAFNILLIAFNIAVLPLIIHAVVTNQGYYDSIELLPLLCISFAFKGLYGVFINPILYYKKTEILPRIMVVSAIVQVVAGVILTRYFGVWGAVWSFFIVRPVQIFLMWKELRAVFAFNFNFQKMVFAPIIYVLAVICLQSLLPEEHLDLLPIIQLVIALSLILIVYRNEIRSAPSLLFSKEPAPGSEK